MTIHAAKGLEFNNVFLVGMEDGVFPGAQSQFDEQDMEEERRLAYVAITRAKKNLVMTNTRSRQVFGSTNYNPPSRFIAEIPHELLEQTGSSFKRTTISASAERSKPLQQNKVERGFSSVKKEPLQSGMRFAVGDGVLHKAFGQGVILSVKSMGNDMLLEIAFEKAGTKKVMAKFAKLEKIG